MAIAIVMQRLPEQVRCMSRRDCMFSAKGLGSRTVKKATGRRPWLSAANASSSSSPAASRPIRAWT
ncbi:hypothetical protein ELG61_25025 [Rhizobium leguminosarum]|nr:hypothetical protein ELG86_25540 [Rhizobium leguminosarum]TBH04756.1 hypothetical protein ELG70_25310 [Rhizobium leguminosarum]TBH14212.1 hypothetical protein ELG68_25130 [Rhizobium leguminosarum]TBH39230.1 hypothetical protein ELG66_26880 [Rhizobium leguminosarum]TBH61953.1 hypothetical protein ELG65_27690 [Rhizobium leguminosarum]